MVTKPIVLNKLLSDKALGQYNFGKNQNSGQNVFVGSCGQYNGGNSTFLDDTTDEGTHQLAHNGQYNSFLENVRSHN